MGKLGGVGVFPAGHIASKLDDRYLHAETDTQIRNAVLTRIACGFDLAFHTALPKAAGDQNRILAHQALGALTLDDLGIDIVDVNLDARLNAGMHQRLVERLVGVEQLHVFADHGDIDRLQGVKLGIEHMHPLGEVSRSRLKTQLVANNLVEAMLMQHQRNAVDGVGILQRNDGTFFNVGEKRDLAPLHLLQLDLAAADQNIGLDADRTQLFDTVLGRLGLCLAGGLDVRHQRQVHENRTTRPQLAANLANRLQER